MLSPQLRRVAAIPSDEEADAIMAECYRLTRVFGGSTWTPEDEFEYRRGMELVVASIGALARINPELWTTIMRNRELLRSLAECYSTFFTVLADHGETE